jgi:ABC-type thiamine transport system substrate-binding protein
MPPARKNQQKASADGVIGIDESNTSAVNDLQLALVE